jgi:hypothetical protein
MRRSGFLNGICTAAASIPLVAQTTSLPKSVAGVGIPNTALAREATAIASACEPPAIFNHSLRTFLFAELLARAKRIDHDVEAVFVASILHDTGLMPAHSSGSELFEVDSANVARALLAKYDIRGPRADVVWDAISLHDQSGIAKWKQTEVALVNAGVGADFGGYAGLLQHDDVAGVLALAPRTGFIPTFLEAVAAFVKRKPDSTGSSWVADVGYRMVPGFHLDNFVDETKVDPFAAGGY